MWLASIISIIPVPTIGMWTRKSLKTVETDKDIFKETGIVGKGNLELNMVILNIVQDYLIFQTFRKTIRLYYYVTCTLYLDPTVFW